MAGRTEEPGRFSPFKVKGQTMVRLAFSIAVLFIGLSAASAGTVKSRAGWVVVDTRQSFQALVERLEATVKSEKMGIVTSASASEGAKAAGLTIPGNKVVVREERPSR